MSASFYWEGEQVEHNPPTAKQQVASVTPQGSQLLLTGTGYSTIPSTITLSMWQEQLSQTTLTTD